MNISLSNLQTFLRRDYLIEGMKFFLSEHYDSVILKSTEIAPISLNEKISVIIPVAREDVQKIKSLRPTYAYIEDDDGDYFYYYIDKVTTLSNNALRAEMTLDVKNTLLTNTKDPATSSNESYELWKKYVSEKSFIARNHVNRYNATDSSNDSTKKLLTLYPTINRIDEGIHPQLRCTSLTKIKDTVDDAQYALAYGESYKNYISDDQKTIIRYFLPFRAYLFRDNSENNPNVVVMTNVKGDSPTYNYAKFADINEIPCGASNLSKILRLPYCPVTKTGDTTTLNLIEKDSVKKYSDFPYLTELQYPSTWHFKGFALENPAWTGGDHTGDLDHDDYFRVNTISSDGPIIDYSNNITGESEVAIINEARAYPLPSFENNDLESVEILPKFTLDYSSITPTDCARGTLEETKLYNSNFYQVRFIFDSNVFFYQSEFLRTGLNAIKVHPIFKVSNGVNSEFIFDFKLTNSQYAFDGAYQSIMPVTRNLEHTLYTSSFIDYLKSGYNYDKKSLALQSQNALFNAGMTIGQGLVNSTIASIVNPVGGITSFIGTGINAVSSIVNNFNQQESRDNSFQAKMASAMGGSASIASSSDVDILNYYSPKLAYGIYSVLTNRQSLEDLFYYFGYAVNAIGRPTFTSRYWFNYVQADLIFNELPLWVDEEMRESLSNEFKNGVTIFHCRAGNYRMGFDKENIETALITKFFS